jgi:hypothetical protein
LNPEGSNKGAMDEQLSKSGEQRAQANDHTKQGVEQTMQLQINTSLEP